MTRHCQSADQGTGVYGHYPVPSLGRLTRGLLLVSVSPSRQAWCVLVDGVFRDLIERRGLVSAVLDPYHVGASQHSQGDRQSEVQCGQSFGVGPKIRTECDRHQEG